MRRALPCLVLSVSWLAASCGGSDPAFGDVAWQVRCPDGFAGCPSDGPAHNVRGFQDDEGIFIGCSVDKLEGDRRIFSFEARDGMARIRGSNITFTGDGGPVEMCTLRVEEDSVTYQAQSSQCGSASPSEAQPCQIRNLAIDKNADPRPSITGEILCRGITAPANPSMFQRDITGTTRGTAATFEFDGCDGSVL